MYSWFDENWQYEMEIIIDSSKIDESLNYLPIAVILDSTNFDFSKAKSDGSDIRFTDSTKQTILPHEKVFYDNVSNKGLFWVKVPNISGNEDTKFYLYCGNSNASSNETPTLVWDSYICVFHGYDNADHTSIIDSKNSKTPVKYAANEPIETNGLLYKAQNFDGVNDKIDLNFNDNYVNVTLECLINSPEVISGHSPKIFNKISYYASDVGDFPIQISQSGGSNIYLTLSKGDDYNADLQIYAHYNGFNTWNYICASVKDKDTAYIRINDNITQSDIDFSISTNTRNWTVGRAAYPYGGGANNEQYKGLIEEIRLSNIYRPPAYSKATSYTIKNELLFYGRLGNKRKIYSIPIDEGNDKKIGTIVINSDEHIQRITKAKNDIKFQEVLHGSNLNGAESDWIECNGMEEAYVKTYFKNSSDTANIRIGFLDFSDEIVYSPQYTINNLGQADNGDWVGDLKIINVSGYQKIQVKLVSSPSNEIRVEIGGKPNSVDISKGHYFRNTQNVEYTAQTDTCLNKAPNINKQDRPSGANVKGLGYCITGYDSSAGEYTKYCNEYNKNTDSWSSKTQCPSPSRNDAYASNIYSKIYIVAGRNSAGGISDNDEYIPITDGWSSKTNYPHAFAGPRSGVLYNKSYVAGESYCDMYVLDNWTTKTNRPVNEVMCGCFVLTHSKLYLAGGYNYTSRHDEYTPDTWANKTDLPTPARGIMDGTTIQNKGYVLGGYTGSTEVHDVDEYNSVTNSWVSKNDCASFGASNTVITL